MSIIPSMFGFLASGKLVRTDFAQIDATHFTINICDADNLNHIAIFLTGATPFPDGTAGLVYLSWSEAGIKDDWQLLGSISNLKPSAIFKISHVKKTEAAASTMNCLTLQEEIPSKFIAKLGISIEPLDVVEQQSLTLQSNSLNNPAVSAEFGKKILLNFFEYASSFALPTQELVTKPPSTYIPFNVLENWYRNFERKLALNPNFWKS
ncbi:protein OPI10 homolog [Planococcus citri]|uniref:protein OPI10 homolog n=1 Tax=Planococcus citri TaxID=170843 RepID=UPI0031F89850